ncbi:MAG: cupin [Planctomycetota bacterium]
MSDDLTQAAGLAGLVAWQDGAIVSRVLLRQPTGNVTLFAFDVGQELSEHTAPFDALVYAVEGRARVTLGGQPQTIETGQLVRFPAQVPHALKAESKFKMLLVMIRS